MLFLNNVKLCQKYFVMLSELLQNQKEIYFLNVHQKRVIAHGHRCRILCAVGLDITLLVKKSQQNILHSTKSIWIVAKILFRLQKFLDT